MRNFRQSPGADQPWGQAVTTAYPDDYSPRSVLTVSPEGVSIGMIIYTGDDESQWMGRSGKAGFQSASAPHNLKRVRRG